MKQWLTYSFIFIITFNFTSAAQTKHVVAVIGKEVAELPSLNQTKSLGVAGPVVGIINDQLVVAGGSNFPDSLPWMGGKKKYYNQVFVFEKKNKQIFSKSISFNLPNSIAYAASCKSSQGIVYAGGENENGISNKVFLLQWDASVNNLITTPLPDLPAPITNASMTCIDQTLYLVGGETSTTASDGFYRLRLNYSKEGWQAMPHLPKALSHTVAAFQFVNHTKKLFVIGGRAKQKNGISNFSSVTYSFDLEKSKWTAEQDLPYAISAGTGIAFLNKYILLFGGDKGDQFNKVEKAIANMNLESNAIKKKEWMDTKNELLAAHPGFSNEVLLYNTQENKWESQGYSSFNTRVTTMAVQWGDVIVLPSGEIKAGVRTPKIIAAKIISNE